jgi:hypothetical protein
MKWRVACAEHLSIYHQQLFDAGWEPFAVTDCKMGVPKVWFRKTCFEDDATEGDAK